MDKLPEVWRELAERAVEAQKRSYSPYSHFRVGCALEDDQGRIFTGCNVENANFSETLCAERTAVVKMVSEGGKRIQRIAIVTPAEAICFPCGSCLQVLQEFGLPKVLSISASGDKFEAVEFPELLPRRFSKEQLNTL
jgi:cytidine deaminase